MAIVGWAEIEVRPVSSYAEPHRHVKIIDTPDRSTMTTTTNPNLIVLGNEYRDIVTGISGMATSHWQKLYGDDLFEIEFEQADGSAGSEWFNSVRLEAVVTDTPDS